MQHADTTSDGQEHTPIQKAVNEKLKLWVGTNWEQMFMCAFNLGLHDLNTLT